MNTNELDQMAQLIKAICDVGEQFRSPPAVWCHALSCSLAVSALAVLPVVLHRAELSGLVDRVTDAITEAATTEVRAVWKELQEAN